MEAPDLVATGAADGAAAFAEAEAGWLLRCAYLLTGQRQAAEDLTQETLLKVWRSWGRVAKADDRRGYVARVMLNTYRSTARKRRVTEVSDVDGTRAPSAPTDQLTSIDDADLVWRGLQVVSARQRAVLVLRYWADMEDADIAAVLRCRRSTVRSLASRGLDALRAEVGDTTA